MYSSNPRKKLKYLFHFLIPSFRNLPDEKSRFTISYCKEVIRESIFIGRLSEVNDQRKSPKRNGTMSRALGRFRGTARSFI